MPFSGIRWRSGAHPEHVARRVVKLGREIDAKVLTIAEGIAEEVHIYMFVSHRWTNRSFQAEDELMAKAVRLSEHLVAIYAVQGAPHGIFLELEGTTPDPKWGIIPEALTYAYPRIMAELAKAFQGA